MRSIITILSIAAIANAKIYVGLCSNEYPVQYTSGVCIIHNGNIVMMDYCEYAKTNNSDGHDQNGYHAEVYRYKGSAFSDKTEVKSVTIGTPDGDRYSIPINHKEQCKLDSGLKYYYDGVPEGDTREGGYMSICRQWCSGNVDGITKHCKDETNSHIDV